MCSINSHNPSRVATTDDGTEDAAEEDAACEGVGEEAKGEPPRRFDAGEGEILERRDITIGLGDGEASEE
jgi:hypothetical protein